ncbi:hypothetical protein SK128_016761, partial [Halocaridina rubra]
MVCLRVIPQDIVARKRSLFLDSAALDLPEIKKLSQQNGLLNTSSSDCSTVDFATAKQKVGFGKTNQLVVQG